MSIGMFVVNPSDDCEKQYIPVLAEAVFNDALLPIAQQFGAEMVCRFGLGLDVRVLDAIQLEKELGVVLERLDVASGVGVHIQDRINRLIAELRRTFEAWPDVVVHIG